LLPPQRHLRRHDALPLHHQQAVGALAVPPSAEALVALQARDHAVVPAARTLRRPAQLPVFAARARAAAASTATATAWPSRLAVVGLAAVSLVLAAGGRGLVVGFRLQALHVDFKLAPGAL